MDCWRNRKKVRALNIARETGLSGPVGRPRECPEKKKLKKEAAMLEGPLVAPCRPSPWSVAALLPFISFVSLQNDFRQFFQVLSLLLLTCTWSVFYLVQLTISLPLWIGVIKTIQFWYIIRTYPNCWNFWYMRKWKYPICGCKYWIIRIYLNYWNSFVCEKRKYPICKVHRVAFQANLAFCSVELFDSLFSQYENILLRSRANFQHFS